MRYLFVHQNFPGQFLHIIQRLGKTKGNEVVFISGANFGRLAGVRRVLYKSEHTLSKETHPALRELESGLGRAEAVARTAQTLKNLGFTPDVIIGHHGWGELLNIVDVYPNTPVIGYFEFFYATDDLDVNFDPEFPPHPLLIPNVRVKNAINLLALNLEQHGQTPTLFQYNTYPQWARKQIFLLREGVNLELCSPDPRIFRKSIKFGSFGIKPQDKLVTYVSRDLEPYRGFHVFMRALPKILSERPDAHVAIVGGDGVSYGGLPAQHGSWRAFILNELHGKLPLERIHFLGKVPYETFRLLLRRSDVHVYLTYPFVASWSLREAMATGCAIVGSRTQPVEEFITDRKTGLLASFLDINDIADKVLELLENKKLSTSLRRAARHHAEKTLDMERYLDAYEAFAQNVINGHPNQYDPG